MQFRKIVMITLYARQQKRHRCIEQYLDSVGEGEGGMLWETQKLKSVIVYIVSLSICHEVMGLDAMILVF